MQTSLFGVFAASSAVTQVLGLPAKTKEGAHTTITASQRGQRISTLLFGIAASLPRIREKRKCVRIHESTSECLTAVPAAARFFRVLPSAHLLLVRMRLVFLRAAERLPHRLRRHRLHRA